MVNEGNEGGNCSLSCSAEACCYIMCVWVICPRGMAVTVKGAMRVINEDIVQATLS